MDAQALERIAEQVRELLGAGAQEALGDRRIARPHRLGELAQDGAGPRAVVHERAVEVEDDDRRRATCARPRRHLAAARDDAEEERARFGRGTAGDQLVRRDDMDAKREAIAEAFPRAQRVLRSRAGLVLPRS